MKRIAALLVVLMLTLTAVPGMVNAKAKAKPKKTAEFGFSVVKQMTSKIAEVNAGEGFVLIQTGKKSTKILTAGATIIKVTENGAQNVSVADLVKNQKAHFWVRKKADANKAHQAFVITQFLGNKALSGQPAAAQFSATSSQGAEGTPSVNLAVSLSKAAAQEVKITYAISGTATGGGTDYAFAASELVIPAGQTSGNIAFTVVDDAAQEGDETVVVTLTAATNASLGANKVHTYTIAASDQAGVGFSSATGSGSESVTTVQIPVSLTAAATQEVRVNYAATGTATGGGTDYTLANGTAVIPAGQTSTNITLAVVNDTVQESDETVIVTLSNPTGVALSGTAIYTYTITDNDVPTIGFTTGSSTASEAVTTATIPVTLSTASSKETKVNYAVTGGTSGAGMDFTLASGTLTIAAGQTTGNITATITNDTTDELDETIIITLSSPVDVALGTNTTHTYTIQDNDNPTVQFSGTTGDGGENTTPVSIAVNLSAAPLASADVQVAYAVTGTATGSGTDYTLANGTLTIAAGQTSGNISLVIVDDAIADPAETVIITLSNPVNATLGANTAFTYTITDND